MSGGITSASGKVEVSEMIGNNGPSEEELEAVMLTLKLSSGWPSLIESGIRWAKANGHALVSQGCGYFRCVNCNVCGRVDRHPSEFNQKCKK